MKKVLLITDVNFWEKSSGNRMRIYSLVEYLAPLVQLTVINTGPAHQDIEQFLNSKFMAEFHVLENSKFLSSNGYGRRLRKFLNDRKFDTIIIEYIHSSFFLNFLEDEAQIILDAHDIISDRAEEFKKFNHPGALYEISRETEIEIFNVYDHVMVLCGPDYKKISSMMGIDKLLLCPHPVTPCRHQIREKVKTITYVASSYLPNKDAISFFIEKCWPHIFTKYNVQLSIYGTVGEGLALPPNMQISLKGFVPDHSEIYKDADIVINPVRFGAGLKIKNVEALANGIPLVTTSHGARGLEAGKNSAYLIADEPEEIIKSISHLIGNVEIRHELSDRAYNFIKDNFSPEKCFAPLLNAIN
jgi:glycosyltransferase involved in cell wall biosynthesis